MVGSSVSHAEDCRMHFPAGDLTQATGCSDPISGWASVLYGQKEPVTAIRVRNSLASSSALVTRIELSANVATENMLPNVGEVLRTKIADAMDIQLTDIPQIEM